MAVDINRVVKIERYWANVFSSLREAQQIAKAENPEFSLLWEHVRQFLNDCFVQTAQEAIIARWESIIGIVPLVTDTMETRRNRILYMMSVTLPYTLRMLKHVYLAQIVGEGNYTVEVDPVACTIIVNINPANVHQREDVASMLDTILPCNMALTFGLMGTPHNTLEEYTHNQLEAYTHNAIRDELLFENN